SRDEHRGHLPQQDLRDRRAKAEEHGGCQREENSSPGARKTLTHDFPAAAPQYDPRWHRCEEKHHTRSSPVADYGGRGENGTAAAQRTIRRADAALPLAGDLHGRNRPTRGRELARMSRAIINTRRSRQTLPGACRESSTRTAGVAMQHFPGLSEARG